MADLPRPRWPRPRMRVTQELVNAFKKVTGKENILFAIAEAALDAPDEPVRDVVFPAVNAAIEPVPTRNRLSDAWSDRVRP
jgi:hypothetical protein